VLARGLLQLNAGHLLAVLRVRAKVAEDAPLAAVDKNGIAQMGFANANVAAIACADGTAAPTTAALLPAPATFVCGER
jgi:hypothetical protein